MKIMIGMPTLGTVSVVMANFLYKLLKRYDGWEIDIVHTSREEIARARNFILQQAVMKNYDYLLFLDDDNPPDDIEFLGKMISADKDMITALVPSRRPDGNGVFRLCIFGEEITPDLKHNYAQYLKVPKGDDIQEIANAGMGCILIKTEVVKRVLETYPFPCETGRFWYVLSEGKYYRVDEGFDTIPDGVLRFQRFMSEDLIFIERAKDLGFKLYVDKNVVCSHIGDNEMINVNKHIIAKNSNLKEKIIG